LGRKVIFELKDHKKINPNWPGLINKEKGIYEMRITNLQGQLMVFYDSIFIDYSAINWIFIKTPSRGLKLFSASIIMGISAPIYAIGPEYGAIPLVLLSPIAIGLISSSNKDLFYANSWYPSMIGSAEQE
jgi:hypothetical protein